MLCVFRDCAAPNVQLLFNWPVFPVPCFLLLLFILFVFVCFPPGSYITVFISFPLAFWLYWLVLEFFNSFSVFFFLLFFFLSLFCFHSYFFIVLILFGFVFFLHSLISCRPFFSYWFDLFISFCLIFHSVSCLLFFTFFDSFCSFIFLSDFDFMTLNLCFLILPFSLYVLLTSFICSFSYFSPLTL